MFCHYFLDLHKQNPRPIDVSHSSTLQVSPVQESGVPNQKSPNFVNPNTPIMAAVREVVVLGGGAGRHASMCSDCTEEEGGRKIARVCTTAHRVEENLESPQSPPISEAKTMQTSTTAKREKSASISPCSLASPTVVHIKPAIAMPSPLSSQGHSCGPSFKELPHSDGSADYGENKDNADSATVPTLSATKKQFQWNSPIEEVIRYLATSAVSQEARVKDLISCNVFAVEPSFLLTSALHP